MTFISICLYRCSSSKNLALSTALSHVPSFSGLNQHTKTNTIKISDKTLLIVKILLNNHENIGSFTPLL